ncbi:hypothetical protein [uncultured Thiodictyon sp.]|uniref:hypothetical protein n=1 Tax=uncultured Thiodictyon sp. TaxID=1846217 RepID=UPI0025E5CDEA|nr:hypothetical protein [uncultured Thiodictyon sp.]
MQDDSDRTGKQKQPSGLGCFGYFVVFAIAVGLIVSGIWILYEAALIVSILLHPSDFLSGVGDGFRHAVHYSDSVLIFIAIPIVALAIALATVGTLTLAFALAVASIRSRTPRVFISYHHSMLLDARTLQSKLDGGGFKALMEPFITAPEHDQILDEIYSMVERAHFVVCLPGPVPSFVEHEVAAAIAQKKPVFFLLAPEQRGIPNTAQHSYPILRLDRLRTAGFIPLLRLLHYLHGSFGSTFRLYFTPTRLPSLIEILKSGLSYASAALVGTSVLIAILSNIRELLAFSAKVEGYLWGTSFGAGAIAMVAWLSVTLALHFSIGGVTTIRNRGIAIRQTKRMLRDGSYSYDTLHRLLRPTKGLLTLLRPFFRKAQLSYHEVRAHDANGSPGTDPAQ